MIEWKDIKTAPKDRGFLALIGGLPYAARYDELGRFIWYMHTNRATGASYRIHKIDGVELLEKTKEEEYDYQPAGVHWRRGFEDKPTHWAEFNQPNN